ncbi:terpenoid synthase, partial [Byssothecium circinans]
RKQLLASLHGQIIRIPDLAPLFAHWPTKTNPELDTIRTHIRDWIDAYAPPSTLQALQSSDIGLFGATWWPNSPFQKLRIITYLAIWLFTWDDEIDINDGTMWDEFGAAQIYRDQTLAYVRYTLGIDTKSPEVTNRVILNFAPIGASLKAAYTREQKQRIYEEMRFFMEMSEREQQLRLSGIIPSVDEFWNYRLGSSAVTVCLAFHEFSYENMHLPASFHEDSDVKSIIRYTNMIVSATNDLFSVKKEIERDAVDSLIPIMYYHVGGTVQAAVDEVVMFIKKEIKAFDAAAERLDRKYQDAESDMRRQVRVYVEGCKYTTTGNLTWSLSTKRY